MNNGKRILFSYLSAVFYALIFGIWGYVIIKHFFLIKESISNVKIFPVIASIILAGIFYLIAASIWRKLLQSFGAAISFSDASRVWLVSVIANYIPGSIWSYLGKGYFGRKLKIQLSKVLIASLLETFLTFFSAVIIILAFQPFIDIGGVYRILIFAVFLVLSFALVMLKPLMMFGIRFYRKHRHIISAKYELSLLGDLVSNLEHRQLAIPISLFALNFILQGIWFFIVANSVIPYTGLEKLPFFIAIWVLAWAAGFLVVFVPGGIGVREGAITLMLTFYGMALNDAILISLLARFEVVAVNGILALWFVAKKQYLSR